MIRFNSVLQPERFGYQLSDSLDDSNLWRQYCNLPPREFLSVRLQEYGTLGDTGVQHTPAGPARRENLTDCMLSLVEHIEDHLRTDGPRSQVVRDMLSNLYLVSLRHSTMEFLAGLKYKGEDKPQYWSFTEEKVSSSKTAKNDRRYELLPPQFDGANPVEQVVNGYYLAHPRCVMGVLDWTWIRYQAQQHVDPCDYGNPWSHELDRLEWDAMHVFCTVADGWRTMAQGLGWLDRVKQNEAQRRIAEQKVA